MFLKRLALEVLVFSIIHVIVDHIISADIGFVNYPEIIHLVTLFMMSISLILESEIQVATTLCLLFIGFRKMNR